MTLASVPSYKSSSGCISFEGGASFLAKVDANVYTEYGVFVSAPGVRVLAMLWARVSTPCVLHAHAYA